MNPTANRVSKDVGLGDTAKDFFSPSHSSDASDLGKHYFEFEVYYGDGDPLDSIRIIGTNQHSPFIISVKSGNFLINYFRIPKSRQT